MKRMIDWLTAVLILFLASAALQAAEPQTQKGGTFVGYGFSGLSELGVDGSTIIAGRYIKNNLAVWAATSFGFKKSDTGDEGSEIKDNSFYINAGAIYQAMKKGSISFRLNPQFQIETTSGDRTGDEGAYTVDSSVIGLGLGLAVEFWASKNISFVGGSVLGYSHGTTTMDYGDREAKTTTSEIGLFPTDNLLAVYFHF